jgi:hypothetical protein
MTFSPAKIYFKKRKSVKTSSEDSIIANVVKHGSETSISIGSDISITWVEGTGLWVIYRSEPSRHNVVKLLFSGKTISEVVEFLIENKFLPDVAFGQKHIGSNVKVQPMPIPNSEPALWDKAKERFWNWAENNSINPKIIDSLTKKMADRDNYGLQKYGTRLQPFNGRNFCDDVIDELLDALVYLDDIKQE